MSVFGLRFPVSKRTDLNFESATMHDGVKLLQCITIWLLKKLFSKVLTLGHVWQFSGKMISVLEIIQFQKLLWLATMLFISSKLYCQTHLTGKPYLPLYIVNSPVNFLLQLWSYSEADRVSEHVLERLSQLNLCSIPDSSGTFSLHKQVHQWTTYLSDDNKAEKQRMCR